LSNYQKTLLIIGLILAGEAIFALPFHLARFFRPTMLEMFNLTATELGAAQGIYGVIAMLAYFPGGLLADRYPAYKLMALSLWLTALCGLYMSTFPGATELMFLFGFFGFSTILLFWGALIRATREWGSKNEQGLAFGLLEGGRGLLAVVLASLGVLLFHISFPLGYDTASFADKQNTFQTIIIGYSLVTALVGIYVWLVFRQFSHSQPVAKEQPFWMQISNNIGFILSRPNVWLQSVIVFCAYVGFKGFDNYSLYAVDVYGYDDIEAAKLITLGSWVRPVAAIIIGLLADRFHVLRMLCICFLILLCADGFFAFSSPDINLAWILLVNVLLTCIAIFGLRSLYFAMFEETKLSTAVTGSAVGLVSVIGFTPDIFVLYVAGLLIDSSPGLVGHQHFFLFLTAFAIIGFIASITLLMRVPRQSR
jgi:nitrate/nitrite transporter NarK